ncbi:MAG: hypothetical protein E6G75_05815, partial [Alphaproteobacteria bacterium]
MPVQTFTSLNDPLAIQGTQAVGINAAGDIVGFYATATSINGFLLSGGAYTTIVDPLDTKHLTQPLGINTAGQIVGRYDTASGDHGFLLSGGTYTTIDDPSATNGTQAAAI